MKMVVMQVGMLGVNCYIVVSDSQNAAVIDPGGEAERILDYLQANKLTLQKILLTHGHIDHIGAVKALKERTGAEIYIHASDAEMLSDPVKNLASPFRMAYQPVSPDHTFSDGSQISLDEITFTVMHTPGHTKGSSVFLTGTTMLSGDTLFQGSIGRIDFYGGDYEAMQQSLKKLIGLETNYTVLSGHGEKTTLGEEKNYNPYLGGSEL